MKVSAKHLISLSLLLLTLFILAGCNQPPPSPGKEKTSNPPPASVKAKPEQPAVSAEKPNKNGQTVKEDTTGKDQPSLVEKKPAQNQPAKPTAPAFTLNELGSKNTLEIPADIKGSKTALVFFSLTWPSCVDEVLQLQPKLTAWQQKNFQLILVTSDEAEDLQGFLQEHPMPVKVLLDPQGKVFDQYKVQYIPSDFLIDENGTVVSSFVGWDTSRSKELESWLSK